jgi:hypothetical protein
VPTFLQPASGDRYVESHRITYPLCASKRLNFKAIFNRCGGIVAEARKRRAGRRVRLSKSVIVPLAAFKTSTVVRSLGSVMFIRFAGR